MPDDIRTTELRQLLARTDHAAHDELFRRVGDNLERLARSLLHGFPSVRRWEGTGDILQNAIIRLQRALKAVTPTNPRQLFALAAEQIRRELLDLARHYYGPRGLGANHASDPGSGFDASAAQAGPVELAEWCEFHEQVAKLPDEEREIIGLLHYQELPQAEVAELLGVDIRTVQRRWQQARLKLHTLMTKSIDHVVPPS